jgi:hypothetical protein
LAKAENTAKNLSTALTGMSIKAKKTTKKISILARQLKKVFLSLIIVKEKEAAIIPKVKYIIYRLITLRI